MMWGSFVMFDNVCLGGQDRGILDGAGGVWVHVWLE